MPCSILLDIQKIPLLPLSQVFVFKEFFISFRKRDLDTFNRDQFLMTYNQNCVIMAPSLRIMECQRRNKPAGARTVQEYFMEVGKWNQTLKNG